MLAQFSTATTLMRLQTNLDYIVSAIAYIRTSLVGTLYQQELWGDIIFCKQTLLHQGDFDKKRISVGCRRLTIDTVQQAWSPCLIHWSGAIYPSYKIVRAISQSILDATVSSVVKSIISSFR
jgi:hypothetical protein